MKGKWKGKEKGKKGKGKEKGKNDGKGAGPLCYWCQRPGHRIADCWDMLGMKGGKSNGWYDSGPKKSWNWNQTWGAWQGKGPGQGGKVNQVSQENTGTSWGVLMITCGDDDEDRLGESSGVCNAVSDGEREWEVIESVVDSGAARSVCPVAMYPNEGTMRSHNGPRTFKVANGTVIPNYGIRQFEGVTDEGHSLELNYNVTEVSNPLDSVSQICDKGNIVVFTKDGGYICGPRGKLGFTRKQDTYVRKTWIKKRKPRDDNAMDVGAVQPTTRFPWQVYP